MTDPTDSSSGPPAEASLPADPDAFAAALVDEATKKSGLVWLTRLGGPARRSEPPPRPQPVWLLWHEGSGYVLHGGSEQPAPALEGASAGAERVAVSVRSKDQGGRLVTWVARTEVVRPDGDEWAVVAPLLMAKRLNLPDGEAAPRRWAAECVVTRLVPTGELIESPGDLSAGSGAAPPPDTPATTFTRLPFVVGTATTKSPKPRRTRRLLRRR